MARGLLGIFSRYGLAGFFRLGYSVVCTWLFYRPARLVRRPIYIRGKAGISWGKDFTTGVGVRLDTFGAGKLLIGQRVQLNDYVHIGAAELVKIGDDVLIASRVFITDHNHGEYQGRCVQSAPGIKPVDRPIISSPVRINDRVWIGEGVMILPGVTVGEGAIVGAGAVVTRDVPPATIAVGCPAKIVKRFDFERGIWMAV